MMSDDILGT